MNNKIDWLNIKISWRVLIKVLVLTSQVIICCFLPSHGCAQDNPSTSHLPHRWEIEPEIGGAWLPSSLPPLLTFSSDRLRADKRRTRLNEAQQALRATYFNPLPVGSAPALVALEKLEHGEANRSVRLALVSLVVSSSDAQLATRLWKSVEPYPDAIPAVLQALVDWRSPVALDYCRQRLERLEPPWSEIQLAINNIAVVGTPSDRQLLESVLRADYAVAPIRLAAARALGQVMKNGLEPLAQELLDSNLPARELLAVELLSEHNSVEAIGLLKQIIGQGGGESSRIAYATLTRTDLQAAQQQAEALSSHPDSGIRLQAIDVLSGLHDEASLHLLAASLSDANPSVRLAARRNLTVKASDSRWQALIAEITRQVLRSDLPAGVEQAILLSVELKQVANCGQLLELLDHPSPSVSVAAAWGLQELDVSGELLKGLLDHASIWSDRMHGRLNDRKAETVDFVRLSHVLECFGRSRYAAAKPLLSEFVPKQSPQMEPTVRASAIWALAMIDAENGNAELSERLLERLLDNEIGNPENELVKFASAIALGYLATLELREAILGAPESRDRKVGQACIWAAEQITRRNPPAVAQPDTSRR